MEELLANPYVPPLILTAVIILVFPLIAGYIVLAERKVLADRSAWGRCGLARTASSSHWPTPSS